MYNFTLCVYKFTLCVYNFSTILVILAPFRPKFGIGTFFGFVFGTNLKNVDKLSNTPVTRLRKLDECVTPMTGNVIVIGVKHLLPS